MRLKTIAVVGIIFLLFFSATIVRLGYLTLVRSEELAVQARAQHSRSFDYFQYARGEIVDRRGRSFTNNRELCIVVMPGMLRNLDNTAALLADILDLETHLVYSRLALGRRLMASPYIFKTGLTLEQATVIRESELAGVFVMTLAARHSRSATAAHILGKLQMGENFTTMRGISGIELLYESYLQNRTDRRVTAQVDAVGRLSSDDWFIVDQPVVKNIVQLTLDIDFQQIAERALAGFNGAAIILDPHTGDILAAASSPSFDAYGWHAPTTADTFVNKAFAFYNPASTFKILLTIAALEYNVYLPGFVCEGYSLVDGQHLIHCWNRSGHGEQSLAQALANSCNPYFVTLGWELGEATLRDLWQRLGLAEQRVLGYQIADGPATLRFNGNVPGDMANISLGENGVRLSPLQVAQLTAISANGGRLLTPRLVQSVTTQDGHILQYIDNEPLAQVVSRFTASRLAMMLRLSVTDGTSRNLQNSLLPVAAKTGTSEIGGIWCTGFAPYELGSTEDVKWVIAVYLTDGHAGGQEAAQVFQQIVNDLALLEGLVETED